MIRSESLYTPSWPLLQRVLGRVLAVAAIVGVTMLGNLRLQASETAKVDQRTAAPRVPVSWAGESIRYGQTSLAETAADPTLGPMIDTDDVDESSNDVQLVPAIYAWNPDVRFVYFRHVSKWM